MSAPLLGFFSGFPQRRFPRAIAERLAAVLHRRSSLVFISAWPEDHARNDADAHGMHGMFVEYGLGFDARHVIDSRMDAAQAQALLRDASCIFLMGGYPKLQLALIHALDLGDILRHASVPVLGVSAGAINMAVRALDTKESLTPYAGLGLADVTVKPHFAPRDEELTALLLRLSSQLPICALEDSSALFVEGGCISHVGALHHIHQGRIRPFADDLLHP